MKSHHKKTKAVGQINRRLNSSLAKQMCLCWCHEQSSGLLVFGQTIPIHSTPCVCNGGDGYTRP